MTQWLKMLNYWYFEYDKFLKYRKKKQSAKIKTKHTIYSQTQQVLERQRVL